MHKFARVFAGLLISSLFASAASWPTFGGDPQRSGWDKDDPEISIDSVKKFQLIWKLKLDNEPKELNSLTPPLIYNPVYTNHGAETYLVVGGSSDNLFVVDAETGKLVWQKHFTNTAPPPSGPQSSGSYFCPNALNDTPVIGSAKGGPTVFIISADGNLHALSIHTGDDRFPPMPFVPAYSKNWSLNISNDVIYTSTSQGCAQAKSAVYGMNVNSSDHKPVMFTSAPNGAGIWGRGGVAIGATGTIYAATGDGPPNPAAGRYSDSLVELAPATLQLLDYFMPGNAAYITRKDLDIGNSTPVIFSFKGREVAVVGGKEGVLYLLDAKSLGGTDHHKPLYRSPQLANEEADIAGRGFWGAFSSWEDADGTRWVYAPVWGAPAKSAQFPVTNGAANDGSVMAFKVVEKDGNPILQPAWISRNLSVPEPPAVANGVVFVLSSGEFTRQIADDGSILTTKQRMSKNPGHAILYALDAKTGKELYSSGDTMPSFTHLGGIAVSEGRVAVTTHDSTVYLFGAPGQ